MSIETDDTILGRCRRELELACTKDEVLSGACCSNSDKRFVVRETHSHVIPGITYNGYLTTVEAIRRERLLTQDKIRIHSVTILVIGENPPDCVAFAHVEYGTLGPHPDS